MTTGKIPSFDTQRWINEAKIIPGKESSPCQKNILRAPQPDKLFFIRTSSAHDLYLHRHITQLSSTGEAKTARTEKETEGLEAEIPSKVIEFFNLLF